MAFTPKIILSNLTHINNKISYLKSCILSFFHDFSGVLQMACAANNGTVNYKQYINKKKWNFLLIKSSLERSSSPPNGLFKCAEHSKTLLSISSFLLFDHSGQTTKVEVSFRQILVRKYISSLVEGRWYSLNTSHSLEHLDICKILWTGAWNTNPPLK